MHLKNNRKFENKIFMYFIDHFLFYLNKKFQLREKEGEGRERANDNFSDYQ